MQSFIFALATVSMAFAIQRLFLIGRSTSLRAREQAYQFHSLRDRLQLLASEDHVKQTSLTYSFLMRTLNLAIRNAGVFKLRELLDLASKVRQSVEETHFEKICEDIQRHDAEVQKLAEEVFQEFFRMLVENDWLVSSGLRVRSYVKSSVSHLAPIVALVDGGVTKVLTVLDPTRVKAVTEARNYRNWANRLSAC